MYSAKKDSNYALFGLRGIFEIHLLITLMCFVTMLFPVGIVWLLLRFSDFVLIWCVLSLIRLGFGHARGIYNLNLYKIIDDDNGNIVFKIATIRPLSFNSEINDLGFIDTVDYFKVKLVTNKHYEPISLKEFLD